MPTLPEKTCCLRLAEILCDTRWDFTAVRYKKAANVFHLTTIAIDEIGEEWSRLESNADVPIQFCPFCGALLKEAA